MHISIDTGVMHSTVPCVQVASSYKLDCNDLTFPVSSCMQVWPWRIQEGYNSVSEGNTVHEKFATDEI